MSSRAWARPPLRATVLFLRLRRLLLNSKYLLIQREEGLGFRVDLVASVCPCNHFSQSPDIRHAGKKAMHNDAQTSNNGVFSSAMRLQPRFEKGKAGMYDQLVKQKQHEEEEKRQRREQLAQAQRIKAEEEDRIAQEKAKAAMAVTASAPLPTASAAVAAPVPAYDPPVSSVSYASGSVRSRSPISAMIHS